MKVRLDECLPIDFRHHLPGHEVHTAEWAGLKGLKNGQLLDRAEQAGYQTLMTAFPTSKILGGEGSLSSSFARGPINWTTCSHWSRRSCWL